LLKDPIDRAEAEYMLISYEDRARNTEKALRMCLDFIEEHHDMEDIGDDRKWKYFHTLYMRRLPDFFLASSRLDDGERILQEARARVSRSSGTLRLPFGLAHAVLLAQTGKPAEARRLMAEELPTPEDLWKVRRDLLEIYCAFLEGKRDEGEELAKLYLASGDSDIHIVKSMFQLSVMLHNTRHPKESLLVCDLLDRSAIMQNPERRANVGDDMVAAFYQSYAIIRQTNGDREGRVALEREAFEKYPHTEKGRHAGSWYAMHLFHQGETDKAVAICNQILEVDDLSDAARKAHLILAMIDYRDGKLEEAERRLEKKRSKITPGADPRLDNWLRLTSQVMEMEKQRIIEARGAPQPISPKENVQIKNAVAPPVQLATVSGRVTDMHTGEPVEGIRVVVSGGGPARAKTGRDGSYLISNAPVGMCDVGTSQKDQYLVPHRQGAISAYYNYYQYSKVYLEPGKETKLDMQVIRGGRIRGKVTDESGNSVANTHIWITNQLNDNSIVAAQTGQLGDYVSYALAPGILLDFLVWTDDGRGSCRRTATLAPGEEMDLNFVVSTENDYSIRGVVTDSEGRRIPKAYVRCYWTKGDNQQRWDDETDEMGRYCFSGLEPDLQYEIYVFAQKIGYLNDQKTIDLKKDDPIVEINFALMKPIRRESE
ncbi:MAG: carboxypeptidase regulatory-like domain-containing protein, partial [bacterium]